MAWTSLYPITSIVERTMVGSTHANLGIIAVEQCRLADCGIAQVLTEDEGTLGSKDGGDMRLLIYYGWTRQFHPQLT